MADIADKDLPDLKTVPIDISEVTLLSPIQLAAKIKVRETDKLTNERLVELLKEYADTIVTIKADLNNLDDQHRAKRQADITRLTEKYGLVVTVIRARLALAVK